MTFFLPVKRKPKKYEERGKHREMGERERNRERWESESERESERERETERDRETSSLSPVVYKFSVKLCWRPLLVQAGTRSAPGTGS